MSADTEQLMELADLLHRQGLEVSTRLVTDAVNEIDHLRAENERLRERLEAKDDSIGHLRTSLAAGHVPDGHARIDGKVVRLERGFVRAWESFLGAPIAEFEPDEDGDYMRVVPLDGEEADDE